MDPDRRRRPWFGDRYGYSFDLCIDTTVGFAVVTEPTWNPQYTSPLAHQDLRLNVNNPASTSTNITVRFLPADGTSSTHTTQTITASGWQQSHFGRYGVGTLEIFVNTGTAPPDLATAVPIRRLKVVETYNSSVRAGIATYAFGASDSAYDVVQVGDTAVIESTGTSPIDLGFVLGFSYYYHRRPVDKQAPDIAGTFGLTVLDFQGNDLSTLLGAYMGLEWGWRELSIGVGVSARQVDRLREMYRPGMVVDPTMKSTDLVRATWGVGPCIVIYAPELLRVKQ